MGLNPTDCRFHSIASPPCITPSPLSHSISGENLFSPPPISSSANFPTPPLLSRFISCITDTYNTLLEKIGALLSRIWSFFSRSSESTPVDSSAPIIPLEIVAKGLSEITLSADDWAFIREAVTVLATYSAWSAYNAKGRLASLHNAASNFHPLKALIEATKDPSLQPHVRIILNTKGYWQWSNFFEQFKVQLIKFKPSLLSGTLLEDIANSFQLEKERLYSFVNKDEWEPLIEYLIKGILSHLENNPIPKTEST